MASCESDRSLVVEVESVSSGVQWRRLYDDDCGRDVVCCVRVPNRFLRQWHAEKAAGSVTSYIDQLNGAVHGRTVTFDVHCERLERRLGRKAGEVSNRAAKTKPFRAREAFLDKFTVFDIYDGDTIDASAVQEELDSMHMVSDNIDVWIKKCKEAEGTIKLLREQLIAGMGHCPVNIGRPLDQVSERQRRRKVNALKESTKTALWFVESFGLFVESVTMRSSEGDSLIVSCNSSGFPPQPPLPVSSAPDSDEALAQTLYLLERFGVSDEFYHELATVHPSLPRLFNISVGL